jgi:beta-galactosidase
MVGTETASTVSTRGIYVNDKEKGYVRAYDLEHPPWATLAEFWWKFYDSRPFLAGGFAWTGFDYRGEPTPYGWPCINSHFGIMDVCGFPKDNFYYYQAWWGAKPVLHLFPHWNCGAGRPGNRGLGAQQPGAGGVIPQRAEPGGAGCGAQYAPHVEGEIFAGND